ncbi:hypothetical protein [Fructilactobacillus cliffordii]|uniref:DUF4231 domain-containing protein n=1 Tax=Fructilactobacillus cliffordii TaxID=2940299 RepID=A0A9Q8ZPL8_9LACO|nr:hypothetical protein [Fructilactobacillus cliffordii]USS86175.1 hypothetical protein M3M38_05635 [Fructilactobacillus cliffordii]USS89244.1 hypothetical protein M3M40_00060 [Fructilactobacillus cliffordii]
MALPTEQQIIEQAQTTVTRLRKKLAYYRTLSAISNITRIILSASIPLLVSMASHNIKILAIVSLTGVAMSIIQGIDSFFDLSGKVSELKQSILSTNKEILLLTSHNDPYDADSEAKNVQRFMGNLAETLDSIVDNIEN